MELLQPLRRICKRNRQIRLSLLDKTVIIRPHLLRDIPAHCRNDLLLRDRATVHLMPERTRDRLPQNHPRPFLRNAHILQHPRRPEVHQHPANIKNQIFNHTISFVLRPARALILLYI